MDQVVNELNKVFDSILLQILRVILVFVSFKVIQRHDFPLFVSKVTESIKMLVVHWIIDRLVDMGVKFEELIPLHLSI
jgi:hypothetical protein